MLASPTGFGARALVKSVANFIAICGLACGALQLVMLSSAFAQVSQSSPMIFDSRKSLPLEPQEPVYHDFYINAGPDAGFRKGMYVTVVRQVPVHDPVQNKQQGTLNVTVAKLQVIHVERGLTVARLFAELTDEERPTLEYEAVMIGDRIDTASMTMDAPSAKKKKAPGKAVDVPVSRSAPVAEAELVPATSREAAPESRTTSQPASGAPAAAPAGGPSITPVLGPAKATLAIPERELTAPVESSISTEQKIASPSAPAPDMVRVLDLTDGAYALY